MLAAALQPDAGAGGRFVIPRAVFVKSASSSGAAISAGSQTVSRASGSPPARRSRSRRNNYFADYVLPMGHGPERHDTHSYERYDGQWIGFRQPVLRAARERLGETVTDSRQVNPGEVWEENELWIELSWRIDPDGSLGIRQHHESRARPGEKLTVDEYYGWKFENSVPGLPERAAAGGLTPLQWMRRYGAFEITSGQGALYEQPVLPGELADLHVTPAGRVCTGTAKPFSPNIVPMGTPEPDGEGRRAVGVQVDGTVRRGFPTPSGRLEFYSSTLADWGWPEHALPGYIKSHVHPDHLAAGQVVLLSTFRLPTQIHTRSANAKWLDELAHTNPVWIHPSDAGRLGIARTGDLVRVETASATLLPKRGSPKGSGPGWSPAVITWGAGGSTASPASAP